MKKSTAISPANIAFIKFWGKKDPELNLPFNDTFSMNLSCCLTTTTVEFSPKYKEDSIVVGGKEVSGGKKDRVIKILNLVREKASFNLKARAVSENSFPEGAGIASSASAFSALALAASCAAGLNLSEKELSILARRGSGSACRSIPSGFSEWKAGNSNDSSYAVQIAKPDFWSLADVVVVTNKEEKKVGSTEGHELATTSPYFKARLARLPTKIRKIKKAFFKKDFLTFGSILEEEAIDLHLTAMSSNPPVYYWNGGTIDVIHATQEWRKDGLLGFFSIDAGPNVHLICLGKDSSEVEKRIKQLKSVLFTITNKPCEGTHLVEKHLF